MKHTNAATQSDPAESSVEEARQALCVDREDKVCPVMAGLLSELGYNLSHCTSLEESLHLTRIRHFDLLFVDWQLKDGTGIELCQMVRTFNTQTPIFFYSTSADELEIQKAVSAGAQGYLARPVEVVNLLQTISHHTTTDHTSLPTPPSGV